MGLSRIGPASFEESAIHGNMRTDGGPGQLTKNHNQCYDASRTEESGKHSLVRLRLGQAKLVGGGRVFLTLREKDAELDA